ncbi:membrane metallo-endopeptidase-like 1 [Rhipicephalus microplus]|uniref:membrane metallo-endopeptidase-like 1 n=1 Tax=Rhipicephalus microplus TaxID=6941 RepID=UPI003F6C3E15
MAEEEALCPARADEPPHKASTFSEHVSAAIGSRSYLSTVAAIAGILVISSMMATSSRRDASGAVPQLAVHGHRLSVADGDTDLAVPVSANSEAHRSGVGQQKNPRRTKSLVRSGAARVHKGGSWHAGSSAENRQQDAAGAGTGEPEYIRQVDGCHSTMCRWQGEYLGGKLDETIDPCMDFYSYACPSRWFHQDTLAAMPYRVYAAGQLKYRLENMFHEIHQAEASADVSGHNASFMSRAADFFLRCVSKKKSRGQGPELEELFLHYGLEGYPYKTSNESSSSSPSPTNLTRIVGMLDRELGLAAIFQPSLTTARRRKQANSVVLFIDAPELTPSMRLKDHVGQDDKDSLLRKIIAGFALLKPRSRKLRKEAAQVLAIDEKLSSVIQMRNGLPTAGHSLASSVSEETSNNDHLVRGALMSVSSLAKDYGSQAWSWDVYMQILMGDIVVKENATEDPRVLVQVDSPGQLEKLVSLLDNHETSALLNYVAFSLTVFLSSALPHGGIAQELITLSHGEHVPQVPEELQSCVHLLARTYRYGALSLARHAVSRDTSEGNSYKYEGDMRAMVDGAREQIATLLRNHTTGTTTAELRTVLQRLDALRVVFLEEPDDSVERLSRYYGASTAGTTAGLSLAKARGSARWSDPERAEENLETRWPPLRVSPRADYFETRNTLLISPSLVSFLSAMLIGLDPLVVPVVGSDVVRALLSVVVGSQQSLDVGKTGQQGSAGHSVSLSRHREEATHCLAEQYANLTGDRKASARSSDLFVDTAVVEPLFELYRTNLAKYPELRDGPNIVELPGKNSLELFFVNYAVAHCEHAPRLVDLAASTDLDRALSPSARLNVALMNSRAFASVFHCKEDDVMNPRNRCQVW